MRSNTIRNRRAATLLLFLLATLATKKIQAQFDMEDSNSTASLRGIHNVGGGVAWASGTNGTVLRTEDGGYLWQTCTIPPGAEKLDFRGIQAFDENTAIVMSSGKGDLSRLYKTTDGCQTWHLLLTNSEPDGFWDGLSFINDLTGMLLGDPVNHRMVIMFTNDGGVTWQLDRLPGLDVSKEIAVFAASNSALMIGGATQIFVTGGKEPLLFRHGNVRVTTTRSESEPSWSHIALPFAAGNSAGIFSIASEPISGCVIGHCLNIFSTRDVAVGGDYKKPDDSTGTAAYTLDFGKTWQSAQTPPHGYRSAVAYDPTQKLWITVGPNGTDISRDDGKNWTPLKPSGYDPPEADKNWNALSLPFVVGPNGRIGRLRTIAQK
jgi:hypothetical protein